MAAIPRDVDLVYWDYFHTDVEFYEEWIDRHRSLGSEPIMAGGVWTWGRFWASLPFRFSTTESRHARLQKQEPAPGVHDPVGR